MNFKLSRYVAMSETFEAGGRKRRIVYSTRTCSSVLVDEDIVKSIYKNDFTKISNELMDRLFQMEIVIPTTENEFAHILKENKDYVATDDTLELTIQPTADCQLGCHYCAQKHSKIKMSGEVTGKTMERVEKKIKKRPFKNLSIMWYGGEPLKALSKIRELSFGFMALADYYNLNYTALMITNGLSLKPNIFRELLEQHIIRHFQITLDGTSEFHDKRRYVKGSIAPTFDIILNNILKIVELPEYDKKYINVRINIDRDNFDDAMKLLDILEANNLQNKISIDPQPVVDWGDKKCATENGYKKEEFAEIETELFLRLYQKGFMGFDDLIPVRQYTPCMVVHQDTAEVIDAYGNIYPCYEYTYVPEYSSSEFRIGNVKNTNQDENPNAITRTWFTDVENEEFAGCKNCNLFPVCGGGCVKNWYVEEDKKGCPAFKYNFSDRLMLNYLDKKKVLAVPA